MSTGSPEVFSAVLRAFRELWCGDRATLKTAASTITSRIALISSMNPDSVGWRDEVAALTDAAESAGHLMATVRDLEVAHRALLLCAITLELGLAPDTHKLSTLRSLARHSWELEHSLTAVILIAMDEDEATRQTWLTLVKGWLPQPSFDQRSGRRRVADASWGDLFQPNASHDDIAALRAPLTILLRVDLAFGLDYLESLHDWELAEHALLLSGAASTFERWSSALAQAPLVFDTSGGWTGAVVSLLLVKRAQNEILLPDGEQLFGRPLNEPTWLCENVVTEIKKRADGLAMLRAWSISAFRDCIAAADSSPNSRDPRIVYRLSCLQQVLDCMPAEVRPTRASGALPAGYPAWFVWYERGLEVHWRAASEDGAIPTAQVVELYEHVARWESVICKDVRERRADVRFGSLHFTVSQLDFHLGMALAVAEHPADAWQALWRGTFDLREMAEFGGFGDDESENWQDRSAASSLTEIVLRFGVAVADTLLRRSSQSNGGHGGAARDLLVLLQTACIEMTSIEVLRANIWTQALRYVFLLWGRLRELAPASEGSAAATTDPEERKLLEYLSTEPSELLLALTVCADNGISEAILVRQLVDSRIEFARAVAQAKRFSQRVPGTERLPDSSIGLANRLCDLLAST
ncbi:MAG: hypothetical protein WAQ08_10880 [Aquabacterium sp.]|uniref:hypothetical protein n=1 Tax=Aquabacterium sp. TaxID=1872578 RepID=UPI003BB1BEF6